MITFFLLFLVTLSLLVLYRVSYRHRTNPQIVQNDTFHEWLLDSLFDYKIVHNCEGHPYLMRWYLIRKKGMALFVHKFVRSDEDRALHDHPWNFIVIPIWQGYIEHNDKGQRRVYPILSARIRSAEYRHRVELIEGKASWSLFFRFTERRVWGLWPAQGFVDSKTWWRNLCE